MPTCARSKASRRASASRSGTLPDAVTFVEDGLVYRVDVVAGQKTGFYLDQRANRAAVRRLAAGREVLNVFCYTGGFTLAALAGGAARVVSIDSSAAAIALAQENLARNPALPARPRGVARGGRLRRIAQAARPRGRLRSHRPRPAEVRADRGACRAAARAYKDVNLLALKLLRPGGLLATFSCSGGIDAGLFRKIVAGAALDAGVDATVIGQLRRRRRSSGRARVSRRRLSQGIAAAQAGVATRTREKRSEGIKQGPSRLPGGALSVAAGWTGSHPAVCGHCVYANRVRRVRRPSGNPT